MTRNPTMGVLALAVAMTALPAAAETVLLDCDVSIVSNSNYNGTERSNTRESGTWRIRLEPDSSRATIVTAPFVYRVGSSDVPFRLNGEPVSMRTSEDAYTFCIQANLSCDTQVGMRNGRYSVSQARIDRRSGAFRVVVDSDNDLLQGWGQHTYSGTCRRAPDQQF
ncbi:hypothetical protein Q0812_05605 [Brevundimonas sp. 2R-24]|uniref:Uncharacterized protein n=1 Tax=Peiella sedimenti TaxID=3061083 RepID=A0ABT8SK19_9CAUL|nr:hypothetical protein [Caulobacteraceae bacterium XZ-24]